MRREKLFSVEPRLISAIGTILFEHRGRDHAIKRPELLAILRRIDPILSDRKMRELIEENFPQTCSCPEGGYFLAKDQEEAKIIAEYLTAYIRGLARRRAAIINSNPAAGQLNLGI
jgi:hypothetical protein